MLQSFALVSFVMLKKFHHTWQRIFLHKNKLIYSYLIITKETAINRLKFLSKCVYEVLEFQVVRSLHSAPERAPLLFRFLRDCSFLQKIITIN